MFSLKKIKDFFFKPLPSLFDVSIGGLLLIPLFNDKVDKAVFLVFYTAFLVIISLSLKPKCSYQSIPLTCIALWSCLGVFIHSFELYKHSITAKYPAFYLMSEGFLYVLFGVLLIRTIIIYSTNPRFIYLLIPIAITTWYFRIEHAGSVTPIAALCVSIIIYLFLSRRFVPGFLGSGIGFLGMILNWKWICMKFACRPMAWHQLTVNIFYRPTRYIDGQVIDPGAQFSQVVVDKLINPHVAPTIKPYLASIFGAGFSQYISPEYMWIDKDMFGWIYRQNDYLALANDLGPVVLIFIGWFLIDSFKRIGITPYLIPFLAICLICFFQLTMYKPDRAGIYLLIESLMITEGIRRKK